MEDRKTYFTYSQKFFGLWDHLDDRGKCVYAKRAISPEIILISPSKKRISSYSSVSMTGREEIENE